MTLTELAERVGVTVVNLSVMKNDRAKAVRYSTLTAICDVLGLPAGRRPVGAVARASRGEPGGRRSLGLTA